MKCFEINQDGYLDAVEYAEGVGRWQSGGGPLWISVDSPEQGNQEVVLREVGLSQQVVRELLQSGHAPRLVALDEGLFFDFPVLISGDPPELRSLSFVCLDRLIITLHGGQPSSSSGSVEGMPSRRAFTERSTSRLACALLVEASIELRQRSSELRRATVVLSRRFDADPGALDLDEIHDLNREIVDLDAISEERAAIMETLELMESPFLDLTQSADQFRVALGNTAATARRLARLDRRAGDLQHRYDAYQQEKIDRRLTRLTLISAIFLPLTFVAGVYGMNFDNMPELHHPLGYPLTMGAMVLATLGMIWWFRARGWMD